MGYSTLYGDMAGGFAPIKDVPKTLVYELANWRNAAASARGEEPPIPERTITKPPSAELRPGQKDTDSLPPYDELDPVIEAYVEDDLGVDDMVSAGFDRALAERVVTDDRPQRVQAAPGGAGGEDHPEGVRARPAHADHQPLRGLNRSAPAVAPYNPSRGPVAQSGQSRGLLTLVPQVRILPGPPMSATTATVGHDAIGRALRATRSARDRPCALIQARPGPRAPWTSCGGGDAVRALSIRAHDRHAGPHHRRRARSGVARPARHGGPSATTGAAARRRSTHPRARRGRRRATGGPTRDRDARDRARAELVQINAPTMSRTSAAVAIAPIAAVAATT